MSVSRVRGGQGGREGSGGGAGAGGGGVERVGRWGECQYNLLTQQ